MPREAERETVNEEGRKREKGKREKGQWQWDKNGETAKGQWSEGKVEKFEAYSFSVI